MRPTALLARTALAGLAATALTVGLAGSASAATAGRTVTVGTNTYNLSVTAPSTLAAAGENVTVTGSGYNTAKGIYVSLCVIPDGVDTNDSSTFTAKPTPCLGGQDESGTTGASHWINSDWYWLAGSNASPYTNVSGRGSFSVPIHVNPNIASGVTCGQNGVKCAIVTRADHFDSNNRDYDVYVPVTFQ
ncbi:hypothetical protein [Streptomyces paludis]|uniref:IPT/TIG domain-containing protein n=1 Tax=Streptomyces paludis TaxID=2282738 RepID=A0A345I0R5_9ACTN|nr:hypothetical protein [Streptomyces paludis]AXG82539.1 hypothetical protein DVK44_12085 [Streptomyces paludis]